jgi:hypothetical protein
MRMAARVVLIAGWAVCCGWHVLALALQPREWKLCVLCAAVLLCP